MKHFVLRGEWNDSPLTRGGRGLMIRNKITQDMLKKAGHPTPREAFAVLSVNGEYFGKVSTPRCRIELTANFI
jgi:hypothetical protein